MKNLHIWIDYRPRLYQELILRALHQIDQIEGGNKLTLHSGRLEDYPDDQPPIDIILHSMDQIIDCPDTPDQADCSSLALLIAFSPKGIQGWRRLTPESKWELIRPFGLQCLLDEVFERANQPF